MPTLALRVQQDGKIQGWDQIVGAAFAYWAVDTDDGDTSYIRLSGTARVSFPLFLMAEGLIPISITLNVTTKQDGGGTREMQMGFYRSGIFALDAGTQWLPTT